MPQAALQQYITLTTDLPNELTLKVLAYSLQELELHDEDLFQFLDVFKLFKCVTRPMITLSYPSPGVLLVTLLFFPKVRLQCSIKLSTLLKDEMSCYLQDFASLAVENIHINGSALDRLSEDGANGLLMKLLHALNVQKLTFYPNTSFHNPMSWFNLVTDVSYEGGYNRLDYLKTDLTNLRCLRVRLFSPSNLEKWFSLLPTIEGASKKLILEFGSFNAITDYLQKFIAEHPDEIEVIITSSRLSLDDSTVEFYSRLENRQQLHLYPDLKTDIQFEKLQKIRNLELLMIKRKTLSDTALTHPSVEKLILSSEYCDSLDLSASTKLNTLQLMGYNKSEGISINKDTFTHLPNQITELLVDNLVSILDPNNLFPLPKYLQALTCNVPDLFRFSMKECEHLGMLNLLYLADIYEDDNLWEYIPRTLSCLSMTVNCLNSDSRFLLGSGIQVCGMTIPDEFQELELEICCISNSKITVCVNCDLPRCDHLTEPYWIKICMPTYTRLKLLVDNPNRFNDRNETRFSVVCSNNVVSNLVVYGSQSMNPFVNSGDIEDKLTLLSSDGSGCDGDYLYL